MSCNLCLGCGTVHIIRDVPYLRYAEWDEPCPECSGGAMKKEWIDEWARWYTPQNEWDTQAAYLAACEKREEEIAFLKNLNACERGLVDRMKEEIAKAKATLMEALDVPISYGWRTKKLIERALEELEGK